MKSWILILCFLGAIGIIHWCQRVLNYLNFIANTLGQLSEKMGSFEADAASGKMHSGSQNP